MAYHIIGFKFWISWCPEIIFSVVPPSVFLRMWLLMGHWTGRSVLQGALRKIFLLTCLAGVYSLTHLHILMEGLQESFHQLWPFIKYQMICLLQAFGCIFPAICICSSFLKLRCLHKCHSWRTKRMSHPQHEFVSSFLVDSKIFLVVVQRTKQWFFEVNLPWLKPYHLYPFVIALIAYNWRKIKGS